MPVTEAYLDASTVQPAANITHIGLVDNTGTELSGSGYARLPVTWDAPVTVGPARVIRPTTDLIFTVGAVTVAGWRGYTALAAGTSYGGGDLTPAALPVPGQYRLNAAATGYAHQPGT